MDDRSADLALDFTKDGAVLVTRDGLHVSDGSVLSLTNGIFIFTGLALADTQHTVLVTGNGEVVHGLNLTHASLVDYTMGDQILASDSSDLLLGHARLLHQALEMGVVVLGLELDARVLHLGDFRCQAALLRIQSSLWRVEESIGVADEGVPFGDGVGSLKVFRVFA